ncbi:hypothetical protein M3Y96_00864900 [Aphelenchoides besseyi]|nr:hypothetical protein M3Y96_00864900 [Aphelenchoides besseyi]
MGKLLAKSFMAAVTYHQEYKDAENRFYYDGRSTLCSINKINKLVILLQLKRDQLVASTPGNCGR